ncbi:hypothetical protein [Nitrosomonas aestuarii]|uniref:hypothetical protein n=1 Tax=Nitrosomonas aestuarii TaxID=52441 RepID=UPI00147D673D|nr:hypothetical protein [Nitrosomonas aestuarii]
MSKEKANQNLQDFLSKLALEEDTTKARLEQDQMGFALHVAFNELDWQSYNMH